VKADQSAVDTIGEQITTTHESVETLKQAMSDKASKTDLDALTALIYAGL